MCVIIIVVIILNFMIRVWNLHYFFSLLGLDWNRRK